MTIDQISLPIIVYRKTAVVTIYPRLYWFLDIGFHYTRDSSDTLPSLSVMDTTLTLRDDKQGILSLRMLAQ